MKKTIIIIVAVLAIIAIIVGVAMYQKKLKDKAANDALVTNGKSKATEPQKQVAINDAATKLKNMNFKLPGM